MQKVTNPIMMTFAGQRVYTIIDHVGRYSKKQYHTPVLGKPGVGDFFIPLPYGKKTDWRLNVLAASGCVAHWNGSIYNLASPQIVDAVVGEVVYPWFYRFLLHSFGVKKYLRAKRVPTRE